MINHTPILGNLLRFAICCIKNFAQQNDGLITFMDAKLVIDADHRLPQALAMARAAETPAYRAEALASLVHRFTDAEGHYPAAQRRRAFTATVGLGG